MFENEFSAAFFNSAWRQFRKAQRLAPARITQNVEYRRTPCGQHHLSNSEFLLFMLNQSGQATGREAGRACDISEEQMGHITNAPPGAGLYQVRLALVPFVNRFPSNTELYRLMTHPARLRARFAGDSH